MLFFRLFITYLKIKKKKANTFFLLQIVHVDNEKKQKKNSFLEIFKDHQTNKGG